MCAWPPGGMIGPSLCSLWTRVSVILCAYLTDDGRADPGLVRNNLGDAFFIFSPGHAEEPHSDRIWTPERYRPTTWVNRTPQQCRDPPLRPDMDPREVSSHDLGASYAAAV